jgi:hypothetical protein
MLPPQPAENATSSEIDVFKLIRDASSSENWVCLHSLGIARHARKEYAESDFVLIGPEGVFCLEVKGGHVVRTDGVWTIGWPDKSYESREGPFKQCQGARWALVNCLRPVLGGDTDSCIGWGVVFPDIIFEERDPEWDLEVVYDQRDKTRSFVDYLRRLSAYFTRRRRETGRPPVAPLGPAPRNAIVEALRGDFNVVPSLRGMLSESARELVALSSEQFRVLDYALHDNNPRLLCDGAAGSGKTLVAAEAARRVADAGRSVLLLCFNDALGRFLQIDLGDRPHIHVRTVHGLMLRLIGEAGMSDEAASLRASGADRYFAALPDVFERACEGLLEAGSLPQYDFVVVDEAQDVMSAPLMSSVDLVLNGGFARGRWAIFMDSGLQSGIYGRVDPSVVTHLNSLSPATFVLNENFRNPKHVVAETCALTGARTPTCRRAFNSKVDYRLIRDRDDGVRKLRALLVELTREGVAAHDITLLSSCAPEKSLAAALARERSLRIDLRATLDSTASDSVTATSISAFKGLENEVVVLTDLPLPDTRAGWRQAALYVGMTRARTKLYAFVDEGFLAAREARL